MPNYIAELNEYYHNNKLIIFVGSGVSMSLGYPNWKELAKLIIQELPIDSTSIISTLEKEIITPLQALDKIGHENRSLALNALEEIFKKVKQTEQENSLPKIIGQNFSKIITTNYDKCIDKHISEDIQKVTYTNKFEFAKLTNYDNFLLKLHGDIDDKANCVLFTDQYENIYNKSIETPTNLLLKSLFINYTFLFVGLSMTDPYINYILHSLNLTFENYNRVHYWITSDKGKLNIPKLNIPKLNII